MIRARKLTNRLDGSRILTRGKATRLETKE
jgi:hypothetical protein